MKMLIKISDVSDIVTTTVLNTTSSDYNNSQNKY